jgi:hypothetical protein
MTSRGAVTVMVALSVNAELIVTSSPLPVSVMLSAPTDGVALIVMPPPVMLSTPPAGPVVLSTPSTLIVLAVTLMSPPVVLTA